jgi:hypothetical protein
VTARVILFQGDALVVDLMDEVVTMSLPGRPESLSFPVETFGAIVAGAIEALDRAVEVGKSVG